MKEHIAKLIESKQTLAKIRDSIELKLEFIKEKLENAEDLTGVVLDDRLYDELLKLSHGDVEMLHKFCLIVGFMTKLDTLRTQFNRQLDESSSNFYEGMINNILSLLNDCLITTVYLLSDLLVDIVQFLSIPGICTYIRSTKRLVTNIFVSLSKINKSDEIELPLVLSIKYLLTQRVYDYKKNDDLPLLAQLKKLQLSNSDKISKEASELIISNLVRLSRRNETCIAQFVSTSVKYMNDELDTAIGKVVYFRILRTIESLELLLERNSKTGAVIKLNLNELWRALIRILITLKTSQADIKLLKRTISLIKGIVNSLQPDLILLNISHIASPFNTLFSDCMNIEYILLNVGMELSSVIDLISKRCPDFYMCLHEVYNTVTAFLLNQLRDEKYLMSDPLLLLNSARILKSCFGNERASDAESLVLQLMKLNQNYITTNSAEDVIYDIILKHLQNASSNHHITLRLILEFINRHNNEELKVQISTIVKKRLYTHEIYPNHGADYLQYSNSLDTFLRKITQHARGNTTHNHKDAEAMYIRSISAASSPIHLTCAENASQDGIKTELPVDDMERPVEESQGNISLTGASPQEMRTSQLPCSVDDAPMDEDDLLIIERIKKNLKRARGK